MIMDNYATHKTAVIRSWLARRPHYDVHFTPTSASWINQVERWFAELTRKQLRRGVHTSPSNSKQTSEPSSRAIMRSPSRIDGPNPQMTSSRPSNHSARKRNRHYAAKFRFAWLAHWYVRTSSKVRQAKPAKPRPSRWEWFSPLSRARI